MIFYFTGTGNSWYAAKHVLNEGERLINIADCVKNKEFSFELEAGETVGIAFPVYFCGAPSIVNYFVKRLTFDQDPSYVYALMTMGAMAGNAAGQLSVLLGKAELPLDAAYAVKMPENYARMYQTPEEDDIAESLAEADEKLAEIKEQIKDHALTAIDGGVVGKAITKSIYPLYVKGRSTAPFYTDERCVGCGVCASRCPVGAIQMVDDKPTWVKEKCVMCMACSRCNAIQYGKTMKKHRRYVNPEYKKVTSCH